jgi:sulfofructose kinase
VSASPVVACVGIATLDLVHRVQAFPTRPVKLRAESFAMSLGGMAALAACAVARLGGSARFLGPIGDDAFGDTLRSRLAEAGVASAMPVVAGATSSHSMVLVDAAGERIIVNHRGSALAALPDGLPLDRLAAAAVLADVRWPAGAKAVLEHANALGLPTVLDADLGEIEALRTLVPLARHVIFSEPGFVQWANVDCDSNAGRARLRSLCDAGAELAAVTRGERGVLYANKGEIAGMPAFAVHAVETLGAGDVFHGAYALALAEKRDVDAALRFASAAAAIKCGRSGGLAALPTRDDVNGLLAG